MTNRNDNGAVSDAQLSFKKDKGGKKTRSDVEMREEFFQHYIVEVVKDEHETYNAAVLSAYEKAGYTMNSNSGARAKAALRKHWPDVEKAITHKIGQGAVIASHVLIHLCTSAKSEQVQLKAAVELLNKGGYNEVQKIEFSEKAADEMTSEERQKEIQALMGKKGLSVVEQA